MAGSSKDNQCRLRACKESRPDSPLGGVAAKMPLDVANHVHKVGKDQLIVSIAVAPEDIVEPLADIGGGGLGGCHTIHKLATDRLG